MLYPIGIQDFEKLREGGYTYVDKTRRVYEMAHGGVYFFLSRPRRFGKSLLISTLEAYFLGKKELFRGLAIEELEQEWKEYPVLHLDLNVGRYNTPQALEEVLDNTLSAWERRYGVPTKTLSNGLRFSEVVQRAYEKTGLPVVILIDEYDKPLLQAITNEALQDEYRSQLKAFYSVMKTQDRYIRFALLTGVTKFGKVSVFSDLNNLNDISIDAHYADICGITEQELLTYFPESIQELAEANKMTYDQARLKLKERYDGYHFEANTPGIYNPFSLLNALSKKSFKDYWFETGTPTFLVELLKETDYDLSRLQEEEVDGSVLGSIDSAPRYPIPVIYQSGYLTIKDHDEEFGTYRVGFPNKEVETGFIKFLLPRYTYMDEGKSVFSVNNFVKEVRKGNVQGFLTRLQAFFADMDFTLTSKGGYEAHYHNILYLVFKLMGFYTQVEYHSSRGSADVVIQTPGYVYIIECKLDRPATEALQQIETRGYATPFAADPRRLFKIGISFSSETRGVEEYLVEE